jgi:hypothetical protein
MQLLKKLAYQETDGSVNEAKQSCFKKFISGHCKIHITEQDATGGGSDAIKNYLTVNPVLNCIHHLQLR